MILHRRERMPQADTQGAVVVDFTAERARLKELRMDAAAEKAARLLGEVRADRAPLSALLAALVAPFNEDCADPLPAEHAACVAPLHAPGR